MLNNLPVHVNQCFSSVKTHEQTRTRLPTHYISTCCYFLQLWIRIIAYPKNTFTGFGDIKTKIKYVMEVFSLFLKFPFYSKQLHSWWDFLQKRVTKKSYKNSWKREKISKMVHGHIKRLRDWNWPWVSDYIVFKMR